MALRSLGSRKNYANNGADFMEISNTVATHGKYFFEMVPFGRVYASYGVPTVIELRFNTGLTWLLKLWCSPPALTCHLSSKTTLTT